MKKRITDALLLLLFPLSMLNAQEADFRNPFDFRMYLSGTFAELRGSHFHSGIDIKTQRSIGHPTYAIEDGYVSRIKVRAYGFGHALYITHPSGHTSVYAHLSRFNDEIQKDVRQKQYAKESFRVNYYPPKSKFPVKKGDIIGYSGNSGSSGGPHLHFEIREAISQKPSNALSYGYKVPDNIDPFIQRIRFYPIGEKSRLNGKTNPQSMYIYKSGKNIRPKTSHIRVSGDIALGIQTYDKLNGSGNHNGPFRVSMFTDSVKFWEFKADKFSFSETRYLNAMIDYASYSRKGHKYYQSYLKPNNKLSMIAVRNKGRVHFEPGQARDIRIEVEDYAGNLSAVNFTLKASDSVYHSKSGLRGKLFRYDRSNRFSKEGIRLSIPAGALYDTLDFRYHSEKMPGNGYSKIHHIHNNRTPLHKNATISIKVDRLVSNGLKQKLLLARLDDKNRRRDEGGNWNNGYITAKTRNLGRYVVMADTVKPKIRPVNFYPGKTVSASGKIEFRITDDFSGIDYYRGEIDGKWVLFKHFPNRNLVRYEVDDKVGKGKHTLKLIVSDERQNIRVYKADLTIQ